MHTQKIVLMKDITCTLAVVVAAHLWLWTSSSFMPSFKGLSNLPIILTLAYTVKKHLLIHCFDDFS